MKFPVEYILKRAYSQRGEINIIAFAISLPVLILVGTVALDIVRYPITKQQIGNAAEVGCDHLILEENENVGYPEAATGMDWCAILSSNNPSRSCPICADGTICTGALDAAGLHVIKYGVSRAFTELTQSGIGVLTHDKSDVRVVGGIYNLIVTSDPVKDGLIVGIETVGEATSNQWGGNLDYSIDLNTILSEQFVLPGDVYLGHVLNYMPPNKKTTTHVPVVAFGIAVRIHNIFKLPAGMQFGAPDADSEAKNDTIIYSTVIRPLQRSIRLSGELS